MSFCLEIQYGASRGEIRDEKENADSSNFTCNCRAVQEVLLLSMLVEGVYALFCICNGRGETSDHKRQGVKPFRSA